VGKNGAVQAAIDGMLGLGRGSVSLVSQLKQQGITKNVVGHCLSTNGGGFLFFGDDVVPSSRVTWVPMAQRTSGYASFQLVFVSLLRCIFRGRFLILTRIKKRHRLSILVFDCSKLLPFCSLWIERLTFRINFLDSSTMLLLCEQSILLFTISSPFQAFDDSLPN
jgi:hypothetical protein